MQHTFLRLVSCEDEASLILAGGVLYDTFLSCTLFLNGSDICSTIHQEDEV
jgi:hypothetical protein